ncbi:MAG: alpha/beta hydrolase [Flavobacteriales bacterium]
MNTTKEQKPALTAPKWIRMSFSILERISPFLSSRIAAFLFFTPIRFNAPIQEQKYLSEAKTKTITFKNNKVKVYEWGDANKAILLVHGWAGRATQVAHLAEPLIKAGYKVYSFDAPGHGNSNGRHTHFIEFSEIILALNKQFPDIESIIGHSMGGSACIHAITQGFNPKKCITIGSPASVDWVLKSYCKQINLSNKVAEIIKSRLERKFSQKFEDLSLRTMVKHIETPGLIIHCKDDVDAPVECAHQIHENWKNSTLLCTQNLGHRRILKNKEVAQTIIDFLKS